MEYVRRLSVSCFQMRNPPPGNYPSDGQQASPTLLVATLRREWMWRLGSKPSLSFNSQDDDLETHFFCRPSIHSSKLDSFFARRRFREEEQLQERDGYDSEGENHRLRFDRKRVTSTLRRMQSRDNLICSEWNSPVASRRHSRNPTD